MVTPVLGNLLLIGCKDIDIWKCKPFLIWTQNVFQWIPLNALFPESKHVAFLCDDC